MIVLPPTSCFEGIYTEALKWLISLSIPCNSLMFLFRVRALYKGSYAVLTLFTLLWASTLSSFAIVFGYKLEVFPNPLIPGTCSATVAASSGYFITFPFAALVLFDSAVTIAVSIHLLTLIPARSWSSRIRTVLFARGMSHAPRLLLRSGQIYYLYVPSDKFQQ